MKWLFIATLVVCTVGILVITAFRRKNSGEPSYRQQLSDRGFTNQPATKTIIEGVVYQDLARSAWTDSKPNIYGAYFLEATSESASYLKRLFINSVPRTEVGTNNVITTTTGIIDRVTRKPAKQFHVEVQSISNGVAVVDAGYYESLEGAGGMEYQLNLVGTNWVIVSRELGAVSQAPSWNPQCLRAFF